MNGYKVFNVSFGPRGPILDDRISRFTYVLDNLAVAHKVTFIVAAGNDGEMSNNDRVQAPSDIVHGLGIGAFTRNGESQVHAPYSCKGPGRECAKLKPDLAAFGGCKNFPIHLVSTSNGNMSLSLGTSFAAPSASRVCAQATEYFERATALLGRALLVHTAQHPDDQPNYLLGHGCIVPSIDDILYCAEPGVAVVFLGDLMPTKMVRLPVPLPSDLQLPGKVKVTWTVAALAPIDANHPNEYTCACVEDTFYPHSQRFLFSKVQNGKTKNKKLHLQNNAADVKKLLAEGWKKASFPTTSSGNEYKDEDALRALDCKWEPLVRRTKKMLGKSLFEPFLILHAISRNRNVDRFEYATIVTIEAPSFEGDLYTEIRRRYPALAPIRLRTEAEIRVQI